VTAPAKLLWLSCSIVVAAILWGAMAIYGCGGRPATPAELTKIQTTSTCSGRVLAIVATSKTRDAACSELQRTVPDDPCYGHMVNAIGVNCQ
jgi:hypothetical protein